MISDLRRLLDPINRKLRLLAGRAVLSLMQDAVLVQIKALDGEPIGKAELFQQYGFRSRPKRGAEGIFLSLGGSRDHAAIICMDDRRYQLDLLDDGEVAIYTDEGDRLHMKRGRVVELVTETFVVKAGQKIRFETPMVEATGDIKDRADNGGTTMGAVREMHDDHDHNENNVLGSPTNKPNQRFGS